MIYAKTCLTVLFSVTLCQKFRIETCCIEVFHQEKLVRIIGCRIWIVVAFAKNFDNTSIVSCILKGNYSGADHFVYLSVSFTFKVKINSRLFPVNVVF